MAEDNIDDEYPEQVEVVGQQDWFLQSIIETVINHGVELGVTISIGGNIVSGVLISGKKYFEELGNSISAASKEEGDTTEVLGNAWKEYQKIYEKPEDADETWQGPTVAYIHLRGAKYYSPGKNPIPEGGVLWRGKLSSVDAFSIGNFTV